MPIYEYQCSACSKTSEVLQKISDPTPDTCGFCGATSSLKKMLSKTSFVLKGGGWYSEAYSSSKKPAATSDATPAKAEAGSTSTAAEAPKAAAPATPAKVEKKD